MRAQALCVVGLICFPVAAWPGGAEAQTAGIEGVVVDSANHVLPGATVTVAGVDSAQAADPPFDAVLDTTVTDGAGAFGFAALPVGAYMVAADLSGYASGMVGPVEVVAGQVLGVRLRLEVAPLSEVVTVDASTGAGQPLEKDEFGTEFLQVFQLPTDRFQDALPLLPGVVRDPRGRISFNGTRPSQSTLLVNGANATDPVTGQFAFELPLSVVETVEVHAVPYSAEFGRVSGAVTEVRTVAGDDHWDLNFGSLLPKPRFRGGTINGINTATPRVQVSGPLKRGRAWISQAFDYRFVRSEVKENIHGAREEVVEGFDVFTQVDLKLTDRHSMIGTLSVFPSTVDNLGISSIDLGEATPEADLGGWNVALVDRLATGANTLWETRVALRGFDVAVRPEGSGPAQLTPDGLRGNYFNEIDRASTQLELGVARLQSWDWRGQQHLVKFGAQVFATSFEGVDRSGPIEVRGADGRLLKRITFRGPGELEASDVMTSGYVQDHWQVSPRLALDLGLRYDQSSMISESHLSPRTAFSLALDQAGRTLVKGGWGLFFDQTFLQVDAFERFQQRVEQEYDGAGSARGALLVFENRIDPRGFEEPTSRVWNLEFDRQLTESLLLRVNYRESRARNRLLVTRVTDPAAPALVLSSTGRLRSREFDATVRWTLANDQGDLYASFSKMRADGDLNDFGEIYDNHRNPLLLENQQSFQPFEVPNRLLLWGVVRLPRGITMTPGIEWRTGFPYTIFSEDYSVVGVRNSSDYPAFFSADLAVTKRMDFLGRRVDVGVQFYNLTSHDNPRDVLSNLASSSFGSFRNSIGSTVALRLGLGF